MEDIKTYSLIEPVKVQSKIDGKYEFVELDTIYLQAPSKQHNRFGFKLKKKYIEAVFGMISILPKDEANKRLNQGGDDKEGNPDAKTVLMVLNASKDFDIESFYDLFIEFLSSGVAFKDSECEQKFNKSDLENLSSDDLELLIAKYIEFFFLTSWMKTLQGS